MSDEEGLFRRDVLKASGAATLAMGAGAGGLLQTLQETDVPADVGHENFVGEDEVTQTICAPNCRGKCPLDVFTRNGKIKKIEPNIPADERYKRGCVLGMSHTQRVYDATRLKYPMIRKSWSADDPQPEKRGEGAQFERVSWDTALSTLADQMKAAKKKHGAESILWHAGSGGDGIGGMCKSRLASLFGGTTDGFFYGIDTNIGQGFNRVASNLWGAFLPPTNAPPDWENCRTMIFWGTDLFRSQHQMDTEWVLDAIQQGAKTVAIDPVYTTTAEKADIWMPIKPGKDTYVALAMMHHVLKEGIHADDFLRDRSLGPALVRQDTGELLKAGDVLRDHDGDGETKEPVAMNTETNEPVALEPETGGPYALFGEYTVDGVATKTALTELKEHVADYPPETAAKIAGVDADDIRTAAEWLATRGPGGVMPSYGLGRYLYGHVMGQAYAILMALTGDYGRSGNIHNQHANIWGGNQYLKVGNYTAPEGGGEGVSASPTTGVGYKDVIDKLEAGDISVIYAMESNMLGNQFPNRQRWLSALENVDLIAWADMHHTPSVQQSDIILPAAHWFEKEDVLTPYPHPHITYRHKVQEPLWEAKSDYWIFDKLANRLGLEDTFKGDKHEELKMLVGRDDRLDFEELYKQGTVEMDHQQILYEDEFGTETGRLEIYDEDAPVEKGPGLPEDGVSLELPKPIEGRTSEDWPTADEYPLTFMQKHGVYRIHSQYEYLDWIREINPEPQLDIHPKDAKKRGIDDGDYVRVYNDRGEMIVRAKYNEGIRPGAVNTDQGWWARDFVKGHHQSLTSAKTAKVGRTFAFYDTRVEVEPAPDDVDTSMYTAGNPRGAGADAAGGD